MKKYNSGKDVVKNEIPLQFRISLKPIIEAGFEVHRELKLERPDLFTSKFISNIDGWLKNFLISRQFELDMNKDSYGFSCEAIKVNNFNHKALFLTNNNVNINIAKTTSPNKLPKASKYRRKYAKTNYFICKN